MAVQIDGHLAASEELSQIKNFVQDTTVISILKDFRGLTLLDFVLNI